MHVVKFASQPASPAYTYVYDGTAYQMFALH